MEEVVGGVEGVKDATLIKRADYCGLVSKNMAEKFPGLT